MAFSNENIRVIVEQGQFSNPAVTDYITKVLIARRDVIGRHGFHRWRLLRTLPLQTENCVH